MQEQSTTPAVLNQGHSVPSTKFWQFLTNLALLRITNRGGKVPEALTPGHQQKAAKAH